MNQNEIPLYVGILRAPQGMSLSVGTAIFACVSPDSCVTDSYMVAVQLTRHLFSFFPHLAKAPIEVEASTVAEVVRALEDLAPGIGFYLCDERGRLRTHVNIFVDKELIRDRRGLSDSVASGAQVHILQALSGG